MQIDLSNSVIIGQLHNWSFINLLFSVLIGISSFYSTYNWRKCRCILIFCVCILDIIDFMYINVWNNQKLFVFWEKCINLIIKLTTSAMYKRGMNQLMDKYFSFKILYLLQTFNVSSLFTSLHSFSIIIYSTSYSFILLHLSHTNIFYLLISISNHSTQQFDKIWGFI